MSSRLLRNIVHTGNYNNGGITHIYLLDTNDFTSYRFADDKLYDNCMVEKITSTIGFTELDSVDESNFTESQSDFLYRQELSTFVRTLDGQKLSDIMFASSKKHIVAFRTTQGRMYCFGSDGGATLSYAQQTGKVTEVTGYQITLRKDSMYPLFELNPDYFNVINVLGTEDNRIMVTEDGMYAIKI